MDALQTGPGPGPASLPMYDPPSCRAANDRLWAGLRDALRAEGHAAPEALSRPNDLMAHWLDPRLVLSQTCGLPFRHLLCGRVTLVGTPDYGLEDCPPGHYRSVIIARADDPRTDLGALAGARMAFNEGLSQSGWGAPWRLAQSRGLRLAPTLRTGAHRLSARAVAEGRADWAALDAVTWRLLCRDEPWSATLRVVETTPPTPGLPLIAAQGADAAALLAACRSAIAALEAGSRATLGLCGIVSIAAEAYLALPVPPAPEPVPETPPDPAP